MKDSLLKGTVIVRTMTPQALTKTEQLGGLYVRSPTEVESVQFAERMRKLTFPDQQQDLRGEIQGGLSAIDGAGHSRGDTFMLL